MGLYTIVLAVRPSADRRCAIPGFEFLMVRNRKRGGWELPGGRAEPGETAAACASREFFEETGRRWRNPLLVERRDGPLGEGHVFLCWAGPMVGVHRAEEILEVGFHQELPRVAELSFPTDPYPELFAVAARVLRTLPGAGARRP